LRNQFSKELKKTNTIPSGMGAGELYHSKWEHFVRLQFLCDTFIPRSSRCNIPVVRIM